MRHEEVWLGRVRWGRRWVTTKYRCTLEQILIEYPEAVQVEGSMQVREVAETDEERVDALAAQAARKSHASRSSGSRAP